MPHKNFILILELDYKFGNGKLISLGEKNLSFLELIIEQAVIMQEVYLQNYPEVKSNHIFAEASYI